MADGTRGNRPLSPFMIGPYYRPQITSMTSILTRITGLSLLVAALLVVWWFLAAAAGPDWFATADAVLTSWFGDVVLTLSLWAMAYHFCAGLRHLLWDTGRGLELETAERLGWAVIGGSVVLTALVLVVI